MKKYIKAIPFAMFPTSIFIFLTTMFKYLIYSTTLRKSFEEFFGGKMSKFNLENTVLMFMAVWVFFILLIASDFEKE